ncbi:MAG: FixH family protein [Rhodocyclaceae bacterium]|nr:FixH family protein [Rhodocyclaceae bacterium]MBR4737383.1 FixH family protein [Rhodocyclaceae bacterium]MBR4877477.1 FixH family protein [Rhodocyclaceae bacterium]
MEHAAASDNKPWYKHPWPWILIALPATAVVAGMITLWLAVVSFDGMVKDEDVHRAKVGQGYEVDESRTQAARQLQLRATVLPDADAMGVTLHLERAPDMALPPMLMLTVQQPAHEQLDQALVLMPTGQPGEYKARTTQAFGNGRRLLLLEDESRVWRLQGTISFPTETEEAAVTLLP